MIPASSLQGVLPVIDNSDNITPHFTSRQLDLEDISLELKSAYALLPPEVGQALFSEYRIADSAMNQMLMNNLLTKEFVLAEAAQGNNLDNDWLQTVTATNDYNPVDDEWNSPDSPEDDVSNDFSF